MGAYQSFLEGIFICGEADVPTVVSNEKATRIVDVRAEATHSAGPENTQWVKVPLDSGKTNQSQLLREAIDQIVEAYQKGEKAVLH